MLFDRALAVLDNSRAPAGVAMAARPDSQTGDETYTLGAGEHMVGALIGWKALLARALRDWRILATSVGAVLRS